MPLFFWADPDMARPYVKGWVPNTITYHLLALGFDRPEGARGAVRLT